MKEYNPQGGSLPYSLLPRVASYRRQPRAIESTTPMGLRKTICGAPTTSQMACGNLSAQTFHPFGYIGKHFVRPFHPIERAGNPSAQTFHPFEYTGNPSFQTSHPIGYADTLPA